MNTHGFEDFIAWGFSQNGIFTVRSAYHLQWRHQFGPSAGQVVQGSSSSNPIWRSIWKLKIPSKIKIFIWRALHGILPLKSILVNRHIGTSGECPICQLGPEDIQHLLFLCSVATDIWRALGVSDLIQSALVTNRAGPAILEALLSSTGQNFQNFDMGLKETIDVACWYLWWTRRRRVRGEVVPPSHRCILSILSITANAAKMAKHSGAPAEVKWIAPPPRQLKLNVDASFHEDMAAGATGAVIRDYQGQFVVASTNYIPYVSSASMAEAIAMKEGMLLANRLGCSSIIAESDSIVTIDACKGVTLGGQILRLSLLIAWIMLRPLVTFPRDANKTAHELARKCFIDKNSCNWDDEPPSFLLGTLIHDVTVL
jgi:ribonuclease HI